MPRQRALWTPGPQPVASVEAVAAVRNWWLAWGSAARVAWAFMRGASASSPQRASRSRGVIAPRTE